jgi:hypothetical protein
MTEVESEGICEEARSRQSLRRHSGGRASGCSTVGSMRRDVDRGRRDLYGIIGRLTLNPDRSARYLVAEAQLKAGRILAKTGIFGSMVAEGGFDLCIQHVLRLPMVPASLRRCMQDDQSPL